MGAFEKAFSGLNLEQKRAVEKIDGPLLVIAGPGTGKTQLLTTRIAHILKTTDTPASSILCLTFTDSAADTMRRRLEGLIGQSAYEVQISTYHSFGAELLRKYPEYTQDISSTALDELGRFSIVSDVLDDANFDIPYKNNRQTIKSLISLISSAKQALLSPKDIITIADANLEFINYATPIIKDSLKNVSRIDKKIMGAFSSLSDTLVSTPQPNALPKQVLALSTICLDELQQALNYFSETGKTNQLTVWKNRWLARDKNGSWKMSGAQVQKRLKAFGEIYELYIAQLAIKNQFDFDDMIIDSIASLEQNDEFKYTLAEQYLYFMLDEFQDTNAAQLRLVELLTDSPVNEKRPNIMAVGDDDQAIYAFQGANYSNMLAFLNMYESVETICLTNNYRSHGDILRLASAVSDQIEGRLVNRIKGVSKDLVAVGEASKSTVRLERRDSLDIASQYSWVANKIAELKKNNSELTVGIMAPKHRHLEPLVPFLTNQGIPLYYERREHIFEEPSIRQLLTMSKLVVNLHSDDIKQADSLWPEVLSYDFWGLKTADIWRLSWQAKDEKLSFTKIVMDDESTKKIGVFFGRLAHLVNQTTLEQQLDSLIGYDDELIDELKLSLKSPYYDFYFSNAKSEQAYLEVLSHLTVLRSALRERQDSIGIALKLNDFVNLADEYERADIKLLNTSHLRQSDLAVELMTTYKAKGKEFDAVFMLNVQDEAWGPLSRSNSDGISLPANLSHIRYQGDSDDERLRLLFTAITRAKSQLYMTNFIHDDNGKKTHPLRYLNEQYTVEPALSKLLPANYQKIIKHDEFSELVEIMQLNWQNRHTSPFKPELSDLLRDRLGRFLLSATHINSFTDTIYGGPQAFYINTILAFPKAPSVSGQFGNAIHETMQYYGLQVQKSKALEIDSVLDYFEDRLSQKKLPQSEHNKFLAKGKNALSLYFSHHKKDLPKKGEQFELKFSGDGIFIGPAHINGVIDRLIIDKKSKTAVVIDYKTGKPAETWNNSSAQHHKYKQQLMTYKLLVEGSSRFKGYKLDKASISFIEPDEDGLMHDLWLEFDDEQMEQHKKLIVAIWHKIMTLEFDDISGYKSTITGIKDFENYLLKSSDDL